MESQRHHTQLIYFLQHELAVSDEAIAMALKHPEQDIALHMILWQYGLVSIDQLGQIFDWLLNRIHDPITDYN
jgi:hypothetical protein